MKKENLFYLIFLITIFLIRLWVIIFPERDFYFLGILIHHFWFGIIFLLITFFVPKRYKLIRLYITAIGFGLIIDELIFMLLGAGKDKEYWALVSSLGTIILAGIIFSIRKRATNLLKFT